MKQVIIFVLILFLYFITVCQSVIDHFISKYKNQNKFAGDENWSPYQCKTFIKLAFVVHKNPKRKNITEHEKITMLNYAGNVGSDSEIFFSEITTQTELDKIFENPDSSSSNGSNFTLIEGAPGIGKTVVAKELAYRWAQNEMLFNIKLLLLISFRETGISQITSFKKLMLHCYREDEKAASYCAEYFIRTQGKNLMIIFDGYDEMATEEQKKKDTIFMRLLARDFVPECHIVVTSRPYITAHLHQHCTCRVEIMGFTNSDRLKYFKENLSSEQFIFVTEFLQEHLIIDSLCYIPLNLMSFLKLVENTKNKDELPKTQTKLTEYTIRLTIARNKEKKKEIVATNSSFQDKEIEKIIKSLASFAYKMLDKEKLVFSETELKGAKIYVKDDEDKYGLLKSVQVDTAENIHVQPKKFYSFVHFSVQEYLAAYHLSTKFNIAQSFELNHKFYDEKYFGVWRMYTGLTDGDKLPLKKFLSGEFYVTAALRYRFGFEFPGIHKKLKDNKITYLRLYQMFLEAPKSKIKESLKDVINTDNDTLNLSKEQKFTQDDMSMLAYFVARSCITQQWELINLSDCNINDERLLMFKRKLCIEDGRKNPIIECLDISGNCNICKLNTIVEFTIDCNFISILKASKIFKDEFNTKIGAVGSYCCNRTLQILDLSENHLRNDNIRNLCNALVHCKNLERLDLSNNKIDDDATDFLVKAIVQWDKLQELKIENNAFGDYDDSNKLIVFVIAHHLECNSQVTIPPNGNVAQESQGQIMALSQGSRISSDSSSYTIETKTLDFKRQTENIKYFIALLGYTNDVRSENSKYIDYISQLHKLSLECIQSEGITLTKNASMFFKDHFKMLEDINLSGLVISEESAEAITFGNKLQCIKLNSCKLSSKAAVLIANRLKIAGSIREIELCNNSLDDNAKEGLVAAFLYCNYLERYDFTENKFSKKTKLLFEFLIPHLKFSGLHLDLSGSLDNVSSFITLLEYMKEVPTNKSCYVENISKITELNLNCLNHQSHTPVKLTVTSSLGFQIFNCLKSLNISGITINEDIANHLVKVFENNSQLEQLFMKKCQITSPTMKIFCHQLKFNSKLRVFELSNNSVDVEAIEELAIAILHWNFLESIKMDRKKFSDHGMLLLRLLMRSTETKSTMHFGKSAAVIKSFIKVLDYASNNTGVRVRKLFNNLFKTTKLSMEVQTQLLELTVNASVSLKNLRNLVSLNVSGVTITEQVTNNLCDLFIDNIVSLKYLIMNDCGLNSNIVIKFADKLKLALTIIDVQFCNNKIDDNATKSLVIAILHWKTLRVIELENNHFSNDSILIFDMLRKFPNTFIDFNGRIDKIIPFISLLGYMADVDIKNSVLVEDVSKTQKLLLDCSQLSHTNVQFEVNASKFFTRFVSLTHLNISGIEISKEVADNLAKALDSNLCSLEHLIMNNCHLTSVNSINIIKKLCKCVKMRELQLSNNSIDDKATENFIVSILHLNTLEILRLEENCFSKDYEKAFYFLANNLKFSDSKINFYDDIDSVISFLILLKYMTIISVNVSQFVDNISKIKSLNLDCSNQNMKYEELELTYKTSQFFQRFQLKSINLSGIHVTGAVVDNICKGFGVDLQYLEYLILNKCKLKSETVIVFMQSLQNANHLKEIELCDNDIDDAATEALAITILHWNLLESFKLEKNHFTENSRKLFEILKGFLRVHNTCIDFSGRIDKIIPFITLLGYMEDVDTKNSVLAEDVSKTQKLLLDCSELNNTNVQFEVNASKFFTRFVSLTHLNISGIVISKEVADNLAKGLDSNLHFLEHLIMNNCQLTSVNSINIIKRLHNCVKMRELQLSNNFIDDKAAQGLVVSILHLNTLETLRLEKNRFSTNHERVFHYISNNLQFSDSEIDLNDDIDSVISFLTLLEYMTIISVNVSQFVDNISKIESLNLDCSKQSMRNKELNLTYKSSQYFQRFQLTNLNVSGIHVTGDVVYNIFIAFGADLQYLFMNNCKLKSEMVIVLVQSLQNAKHLKEIELCDNDIDDAATEALAIAILHWNLLESIKLEKNNFTENSTKLFEILKGFLRVSNTFIDFNDRIDKIIPFITLLGYMADIDNKNSVLVEDVSKTQKLLLDCSQLSHTNVQFEVNASKFFTRFVSLTHLNISGIEISKEVADNLAKALDSNLCSLEHLIMNNCQLISVKVFDVIKRLQNCGKIRELQLCNNFIDDEATELLVVTMVCCKAFEMLGHTGNHFSKKTELLFEFLLPHLTFSDLSLDLSSSLDNVSFFITLLEYMKEVPTNKSCYVENISKITELNLNCLNHQKDTPVGLTVSSSVGFQIFNCLKSLNISGITINEDIANHLVKVFENNSQLEQLFMNKCQIASPTMKIFCRQLKFNFKLKVFELSENSVDDEAIEELAIAILHWNLLECIKIDKNWFSDHGMLLLEMLTKDMKPESTVHFGKRCSVIKSFIEVLEYTSNNSGERVTQFFNNLFKTTKLSMEVQTQLLELTVNASVSLKNLRNLVSLNVSGVTITEQVTNDLCDLFNDNIVSLKHLIMNDCGLNSNIVIKFADKLKLALTIIDVQFCNNKIDDNATKSLVIAILHWKTLRAIELENNHFSNDSILIFDMLRKFPNTFIDFNGRIDKMIPFISLLGYMADVDIKNSVLVEDVSKTQKLLLDCSELSHTNVQFEMNASKFFTRFVSLTHLNISGIGISKEVADNLAKALDSNLCSLEHLIMNLCQLTSVNSINIIKTLCKCVNMRELQLLNNSIDDEATEDLIVSILHLNALDILRLEENHFSKKHEKAFYFLTNNLKFSDSKIDFYDDIDSVMSFLTLLEYMTIISVNVSQFVDNISKIKSLNLDCSNQNMKYEELELTYKTSQFFQRFQLKSINLSGIHVTGAVVDNICKGFGVDLQYLEYLILNKCKLKSETVIVFMQSLQNANHLKEIELCDNDIDDAATEALAITILHWNLLESFELEKNHFTENSRKLFEILKGFLRVHNTFIDFSGRIDKIIPFITLLGYMEDVDTKNSVLVEDVSKTQKLLLDCSELNNTNVQFEVNASKFFTRFVSLTHLNISGIVISKEVADNLTKGLDSNLCSLEHLIMNNCQLTSVNSINITKRLHNCVKMRELQLSNNFIDDKAAQGLVVSILHLNTLETLRLKENRFSANHERLFHYISNNLQFSDSEIDLNDDIDSVISFLILLEYMTIISVNVSQFVDNISKVENLNLDCSNSNTKFEELELTCKASQFFQRFKLKNINLSGIHVTGAVVDSICKGFGADLQYLEYLFMNNCKLKSKTVIVFMQSLQNAKHLKEIELCDNDIDDEATEALAIAILHWNLLEPIKLKNTKLDEQNILLFELLFADFKCESIVFSNTYAIKSFLSVLEYISLNDGKKTLQFTNNIINTTTLSLTYNQNQPALTLSPQASRLLQNFSNLKVLNISGIIIDQQVTNMLCTAFGNNLNTLEHLILNNCGMTTEMFDKFLMQLKGAPNMETLEWCNNAIISNEILEPIATALFSWNSFQSMKYSKDFLSSKCVLFLELMVIQDQTTTTLLDFNYNYYSIKSLISVLNNLSEYSNSTVAHFKANISKATELLLDCSPFQTKVELPYKSAVFLKNLTYLTKLNVSGIKIGEDIEDIFISVFKGGLQKLQCLFMNKCQLHSPVVIEFAKALQNKNIKELQMCDNLIDDEAIEELVVTFLHWNSPRIELNNNKFSEIGQLLLSLMTSEFDCERDTIKIINDDGYVKIFLTILDHISNEKFKENSSKVCVNFSKVNVLSLSYSCSFQERIQLTKNSAESFTHFTKLSQLEINGIIICEQAAKTISIALAKNVLKVLKLNYCQLNSHSALILLPVQNNAITLKELDFSNNEIEHDATHPLVETLLKMPKLEMIRFGGNKFKNQNMHIITEYLLKFKELKSSKIRFHDSNHVYAFLTLLKCMKNISGDVSCQVNNISKMDKLHIKSIGFTKRICLYCKQLTHLRKLKLKGIHFTSMGISILADCLAKHFLLLEKLVLSNCGLDSKSAVKLLSTDTGMIPVAFRNLKIIDFSCNLIKDDALKPLVNSFLQMPELQKLHFYGNHFTNMVPILSIICDCKNYTKNSEIDYSRKHGSRVCINALFDVLSYIEDATIVQPYHVQNIVNIKRLNLEYYHDDPIVLTENVAIFFQRFFDLAELNLSGICIHPDAVGNIADILQHNCNLSTLKLSHCQLDSNSIFRLFPSSKPSIPAAYKALKEIDLSKNNICDKAVLSLTASLLQMCQLEKLHFNNNQLNQHNINIIFRIIMKLKVENPTLEYFSYENDLVDCVSSFLALLSIAKDVSLEASQQVKNIMNLSKLTLYYTDELKQCVLTEESSIFFERFTSLRTLNLYGIKFQLQAVTVFAKALALNLCTLEELNLNACGLTSDTITEIISSLTKEKLKVLCLSNNEIDFNATKVISNFVINNTILTEINISHNKVTSEGIVTLTEGLANCRNLEKLDLSHNRITDDATESLHKLMKQLYQYGNFKSLQIDNNYLSQQSIKTIQSAVSWSMWLKHNI